MSPTVPLAAGDPDPLDLDAADQLERNEAGRLDLVRARAERWIGGISALGALLGTVLVVTGRDTIRHIYVGWRIAAASAIALALMLLAYGTYRAYQAAFGATDSLDEIKPIPLTGLHNRLSQARRGAATKALGHLAGAIKAVFVAIALVAGSVAITWFAPTGADHSRKSICVYSNGHLVIDIGEDSPAGKAVADATVGRCP